MGRAQTQMLSHERNPWVILSANVFGFAICFAAWVINSILVTYLVQHNLFQWSEAQFGLLLGLPILSGSIVRLPLGVLTDKLGGRVIFTLVLLISALGMLYESFATSYLDFVISGLIFGVAGGSFAVGVAYVSACFDKKTQGFALGIFGVGNLGAGLTTMFAPLLLQSFTQHGSHPEKWTLLPQLYALVLAATALLYVLLTSTKVSETKKSFAELLAPLSSTAVYRYCFYYFILFGGFVGHSQWLVIYYLSAYELQLTTAGWLAALYSIPCSLMRVVGGKLSDLYGARKILRFSFTAMFIIVALLSFPMMHITTPGKATFATSGGEVISVSEAEIVVKEAEEKIKKYPLVTKVASKLGKFAVFPKENFWQEPVVAPGDHIKGGQLIAKGVVHIYFQANVGIFAGFVVVLGLVMGLGMGAVFKAIPEHFPKTVGLVGGTVAMIGSLGGFFYPTVFAFLLEWIGLWTASWIIFLALIFLAMKLEKWHK